MNKRMRQSGHWLLLSLLLSLLLLAQPAVNNLVQSDHAGVAGQGGSMPMSCSVDDHGCHKQLLDQQMSDCCDQASISDCSDHCSASSLAMLAPHHPNIDLPVLQPLQARGSPASPFETPPEQPPRLV